MLKEQSEVKVAALPKSPKASNKGVIINFLIQFLVVAVAFFAIGFAVGQKRVEINKRELIPQITVSNQLPSANQNIDFSLFWEVFETLPQKFIDKSAFDSQKLLYGAISGMVRSLGDPYTVFLNPEQNEAIRDELSGTYEGVGIQIGFNKEKRLVVISPLKGTPAAAAGLRARDLILKIDDKDTFDLTLPEAVDLIRGEAGSKVRLTLLREANGSESFEVEIERAKIQVKSVEFEFREVKGESVALIKVSRFGETTDSEWDSAVSQILDKGVDGVIVDMRNNPGGLLSSSVHLASEFLKGTIVKQELADGTVASLSADREGRMQKTSLIVLVNEGSASASEIFAGAVQDRKRGKIVGEKTFGKGTVQDVVDLLGGSGLHVTVAKWLTPNGNSINDVGITPDVIVEQEDGVGDLEISDPQLEKAQELIS